MVEEGREPRHEVQADDLPAAGRPTAELAPHVMDRDGLLVGILRLGHVGDAAAADVALDGELDVLDHRLRLPALLVEQVQPEREARAGQLAGEVEVRAHAVRELVHEVPVDGVPAGDHVLGCVGRHAPTGRDALAIVEGVVHVVEPLRGDDVVGVEDRNGVIGSAGDDLLQAPGEDVALAAARHRLLPHDGAGLARPRRGLVRTVVGQHDHVPKLAGIARHHDALDG